MVFLAEMVDEGVSMFYDFVKENHYCKDCIQQTPTLLSAFLGSAPYANKMQTNNNISHFHRRR
jgi:hypothetical protein